MKREISIDSISQLAIPSLTIFSYSLTSLKYPEWGLVVGLLAQPFWIYSSHKAYKEAGQEGLFITAIIMTAVIIAGIINYWFI